MERTNVAFAQFTSSLLKKQRKQTSSSQLFSRTPAFDHSVFGVLILILQDKQNPLEFYEDSKQETGDQRQN